MDGPDILRLWETVHMTLDDRQREAFLRRPEVEVLAALPGTAVRAAMPRSRRLARIADLATSSAWWFEGKPCDDDGLVSCARCKPHDYPLVVVVTAGDGAAFHKSADCEWLLKGQSAVAAGGGQPAPVGQVNVQVALGAGRFPCLACFPPS